MIHKTILQKRRILLLQKRAIVHTNIELTNNHIHKHISSHLIFKYVHLWRRITVFNGKKNLLMKMISLSWFSVILMMLSWSLCKLKRISFSYLNVNDIFHLLDGLWIGQQYDTIHIVFKCLSTLEFQGK